MQTIDLLVIASYLVATAWLGLRLSGKQTGLKDYFLGGRDLTWWAVCLPGRRSARRPASTATLDAGGSIGGGEPDTWSVGFFSEEG